MTTAGEALAIHRTVQGPISERTVNISHFRNHHLTTNPVGSEIGPSCAMERLLAQVKVLHWLNSNKGTKTLTGIVAKSI
jgi:hypothetical protein